MNSKIAIITSGHPPTDERIFFKMGMTFAKFDYKVNIICSTLKVDKMDEGITLSGFDGMNLPKNEKVAAFINCLERFSPDIIIGCEPLTILAAHKYRILTQRKVKIFSDVTEWYPENVALKLSGLKRLASYFVLSLFNIYTANLADALILGEITKLRRYKLIAPLKPKKIIGYYPVLKYFKCSPPPFDGRTLTLCYAGVITFERGILTLLHAARRIAVLHPDLKVVLKIMGRFQYEYEQQEFMTEAAKEKMVTFEFIDWCRYPEISEKIKSADICFDLRKYTFIYRNSLPIKIFEYMASGKPVVFSDIKPIRKEIKNYDFGSLTDPESLDMITSIISEYIKNPEMLQKHSSAARRQAENSYSWESLEAELIDFIESV